MEKIIIPTREKVEADISLPGSKSISNRALVIGALAEGETTLKNFLQSEDTDVMKGCLTALGLEIEHSVEELLIRGRGGEIPAGRAHLDTINSGTTMRFLTGLVSLGKGSYNLDGNRRMRQRPIEPLLACLRRLGVNARSKKGNGCPPVKVKTAGIKGGDCELPGDISSQFLSSLLLSGPYAEKEITIRVEGALASKPYISLTLRLMEDFGVTVENEDFTLFRIPSGQKYHGRNYQIEGDASSASYFWAAAAITGGRVRVTNVGENSIQGDARFAALLGKMGARVRGGSNWLEVSGPLKRGIEVDLNDMPDTVPTLAVAALFAPGRTEIRNVANLRYKESDRLRALFTELSRIGAKVEELPDGLIVEGADLHGAEIETYRDHRIAMALSLAGLRIPGIEIRDPDCVNKTFPTFFDLFLSL